jgi:ubiquinone/menaquinone biosynthesis C-methylase UbiE
MNSTASTARPAMGAWRRPVTSAQAALECLIARAYGLAYDSVVTGFAPWEALLSEIETFIAASAPADPGRALRILDVACGTGTVAFRLAKHGHSIVGVDAVSHLIDVARARVRAGGVGDVAFHTADIARDPLPAGAPFDVLVSMHTLYWHAEPDALLRACRRALRPGGHALFLTYSRPAHVLATFGRLRAREGTRRAIEGLRWLVPTAAFDSFRNHHPRYLSEIEFHERLGAAGFDVLASRQTFLSGISLLAWTKTKED